MTRLDKSCDDIWISMGDDTTRRDDSKQLTEIMGPKASFSNYEAILAIRRTSNKKENSLCHEPNGVLDL